MNINPSGMKIKKKTDSKDSTTEEKIKNAARIIFTRKGYAATRTRDIAEEAGFNLALLNYYFRSKEKLFNIIMLESLLGFMQSMLSVFNNKNTSLDEKIETLASNYIDLLTNQPDIPLFILSEIRANPDAFVSKMQVKDFIMNSYFIKQLQEELIKNKTISVHPLHFLMNMMAMIVFPFVGMPVFKNVGELNQDEFIALMQQRKLLIPKWFQAIMKAG